MSECVLKALACRGLRVGPSKFSTRLFGKGFASGVPEIPSCNTSKEWLLPCLHGGCGAVGLLNLSVYLFRADIVDCQDCLV